MRIVYSDQHVLHDTSRLQRDGRPFLSDEVPPRAEIILHALQAARLGPVAAPKDHGLDAILAVHDADYIDYLRTAFEEHRRRSAQSSVLFADYCAPRGARRKPRAFAGRKGYYAFGSDDPIVAGTWSAAYWSAQCALAAAELARATGENAYAVCRPPGHHAHADCFGGYCYLNNAAIAARWLGDKTAILDIDYHHGNGTQEIFFSDPTVLYCSLHADPDQEYPYYWGGADERGEGPGLGFNRNWPLPLGTGDAVYLRALDEALESIVDFEPRHLVVSVGFDIVAGDPVGGFNVTRQGLAEVGRRIARMAGGVPVVLVQEGGYLLDDLGANAVAFLGAFV